MADPSMPLLIERKKLGGALTRGEIETVCNGFLDGTVPDYQVAALLMAIRWRGMTIEETLALTEALVASGETLEWPRDRPVVDKHSTGGVGDKTSIALVPLLAAAGVTFVKMSGRGLGHTGGTLDKLESIPGFRVDLTPSQTRAQVERIGCALIGQSPSLVPADGALYALRDVTATVDSIPLIASSVMSKKLAAGAPAIVLDVKYGSGAFMATAAEARELAEMMVGIGTGAGRRVRAVLSSMAEPLGHAVGNAVEVREALEVIDGGGPEDLRALTLELGAHLMVLANGSDLEDARTALAILLDRGLAADKLEQLIEAQGGDPQVVRDPARLPAPTRMVTVAAPADGWVERFDARGVADAALHLGAGRRKKGDQVDHRAGVRVLAKRGARVAAGEPVAEIHVGDHGEWQARDALLGALRISPSPIEPDPHPFEIVGS